MASWEYVYCILEGDDLPTGDYSGLDGAPVRAIAHRGVSAVVSTVLHPRVPVTRRHVLDHERLVEELMAKRTLLPVRFGTVLKGQLGVKLELSQGREIYLSDLRRVRGKVELGVRVLALQKPAAIEDQLSLDQGPSGPGARYLMERLRQYDRVRIARECLEDWACSIDARLLRNAEERRTSWAPSENMVMCRAYLVWRDKVVAFRREIEAQREAFPELQFLLTGPWPTYSFVTPIPRDTGMPQDGVDEGNGCRRG